MFKPHEFSENIGVSTKTLQHWDTSRKLPAKWTLSGHRFYTEEGYDKPVQYLTELDKT